MPTRYVQKWSLMCTKGFLSRDIAIMWIQLIINRNIVTHNFVTLLEENWHFLRRWISSCNLITRLSDLEVHQPCFVVRDNSTSFEVDKMHSFPLYFSALAVYSQRWHFQGNICLSLRWIESRKGSNGGFSPCEISCSHFPQTTPHRKAAVMLLTLTSIQPTPNPASHFQMHGWCCHRREVIYCKVWS